jgi:hypothetical protein
MKRIFCLTLFALFAAVLLTSCEDCAKCAFDQFTVTSQQNGSDVIRVDCREIMKLSRATTFKGSYLPAVTPDFDVFPVVRAPNNVYYPNNRLNFYPDGTWTGDVYIGYDKNKEGESFDIVFVASKGDVSKKIQEIVDSNGARTLSAGDMQGKTKIKEISRINVVMRVPCGQ